VCDGGINLGGNDDGFSQLVLVEVPDETVVISRVGDSNSGLCGVCLARTK